MSDVRASVRAYADWLAARLGSRLVVDDLARKQKLMRKEAFAFPGAPDPWLTAEGT